MPAAGSRSREAGASTLILGVDPGGRHTGYGLVLAAPDRLSLVAQGRCSPPPAWSLPRRLVYIHQHLQELIEGHRPQAVAVEAVLHGHNVRAARKLGQARGVALLAAAQAGEEIFEYAPALVKSTVAGYGQAEKGQVARMVAELLNFHEPLAPDAADALAVAVCHASLGRASRLVPGGTRSARGSWRHLTESDLAGLMNKAAKP